MIQMTIKPKSFLREKENLPTAQWVYIHISYFFIVHISSIFALFRSQNLDFVRENSNILLIETLFLAQKFKLVIWQVFLRVHLLNKNWTFVLVCRLGKLIFGQTLDFWPSVIPTGCPNKF